MQTTHKIGGGSVDGYVDYLTSASDRGDYYTTNAGAESGEDGHEDVGRAAGRWHGPPELLARLGLSRDEPVQREQLASLMNGLSPADGSELRPAGGNGARVAGIDVTFSPPKSVSVLWALSSPYERVQIEAAHGRAVAGAIARIERDVQLVRTRTGGELRHERAARLLAAEFVHTSSRLTRDEERGGVPDPQLHSHVVVLGAQRTDGRFAAVDSRELFRSARANGAWYRAELAQGLQHLGLEIRGRTGNGSRYFEVAGVPEKLSERWSARSADIERAAAQFRTRYGRDPRGGELGSLTVGTRGTKATTATVDVNAAWRAVGEEYGLSREQAQSLFTGMDSSSAQGLTEGQAHDLARELVSDATRGRSMVSERDLHARAYELAAGVCPPEQADRVLDGLMQSGELVALRGGMWTTRELREREQATLTLAASRAGERAVPVSEQTLKEAQRETGRELGGSLSQEQREALGSVTGRGGVSVLVGQAGTGKGVVLSAASSAWQKEGYHVIGTAVAGVVAERLGAEAKLERSMTTDRLLASVQSGHMHLGPDTVVVMDETGMADTNRLAALVEVTAERESKLVLVGDQAQLPSIAAGGMFAELQEQVPSAELTEVHRAHHAWEREAWAQLRDGQSHEALAAYEARDRLHISDTRDEAAQQALAAWEQARQENPGELSVILTDASNVELDRINALAQEHRASANELGSERVELPDRPYGLASGDEVIFTKALSVPGQARVENGTLGAVLDTNGAESKLTVQTQGAHEREVSVNTSEFKDMRLAYAQHVYKAQGLTVQRAFVLTGGWQTDRERAYVAVSRAQERTDIYVSREDLGEEGMDAGAIERLGEAMAESHAQQASITAPLAERDPGHGIDAVAGMELEPPGGLGPGAGTDPPPGPGAGPTTEPDATLSREPAPRDESGREHERESEVGRIMREQQGHEHDRDLGHGIE
jgi:conjugative relaxase-like TrwC/TraI family protein